MWTGIERTSWQCRATGHTEIGLRNHPQNEVLRADADQQGVDLNAGNWHFLRPNRYEDAKASITEQFGLPLEKQDVDEYDNLE